MRSSDIFFVSVVTSTRSFTCLATTDLGEQVVDLVLRRAQLDLRIDDPCRADQLLGDDLRVAELVRPRRRRDEHHLPHLAEELVEAQRAVVERRRKPEAVVDERLLARAVALVHPADLRDRLVRLVDEDDEVVREVVDQRERMRAGWAPLEHTGVVLDPVAEAELLEHLDVVLGALPDPVRLEHPALRLELRDLLLELVADLVDGAVDGRLRGMYSVAGQIARLSSFESTSPVSGSKCEICSTSSPNIEMR